ncbi:hypothetical protein EV182_003349 [Spiromyces aspiralis]|uniref:Uncharacterized protein n=1 Tax=Spiromyces aspiralis TaxID=68401 RepID=A0ACC1HEI4_9FUNG|nr:hypothetical protein EV182_003349 [Spiromyces aspiralis]
MQQNSQELESFRRQWLKEIAAGQTVSTQRPRRSRSRGAGRSAATRAPAATNASLAAPVTAASGEKEAEALAPSAETTPAPESAPSNHERAIDYYLAAVICEQEGKLGDALVNYRNAFKHNPNVDVAYRRLLQERAQSKSKNELKQAEIGLQRQWQANRTSKQHQKHREDIPMSYVPMGLISVIPDEKALGEKAFPSQLSEVDELVSQFGELSLECQPLVESRPVHINRLPQELIVHVLKILSVIDVQAVGRAAAMCRRLAMLSRDPHLWRFANIYSHIHPVSGRTLDARASLGFGSGQDAHLMPLRPLTMRQLVSELPQYRDDWRAMYMHRPRVRFDGVYISTCNYVRPGSNDNSFFAPVYLVTYYRYLRFYRDGTCVKLLTPDEPALVVRKLAWDCRLKGVQRGIYTVGMAACDGGADASDPDGDPLLLHPASLARRVKVVVRDPVRGAIDFCLELSIGSTHHGKHNKLSWINYTSIDGDSRITEYDLATFKPFYFSRVRSYTATPSL